MERHTKKLHGRSYIIQSILGLGLWATLSGVATVRVLAAPELALWTKLGVCIFLWGLLVWFVVILHRYYLRLPDA